MRDKRFFDFADIVFVQKMAKSHIRCRIYFQNVSSISKSDSPRPPRLPKRHCDGGRDRAVTAS
jgi:hypothetical protein